MGKRKKPKRKCGRCNRYKARHLYHADQWNLKKKPPTCKSCRTQHDPAYRQSRDHYYQSTYGITLEEYEAMLKVQGGKCAICGNKPGKKRLAVDHDHKEEKRVGSRLSVRGLLCRRCNEYLGHVRDDPLVGHRLTRYLDMWPSRKVIGGDK